MIGNSRSGALRLLTVKASTSENRIACSIASRENSLRSSGAISNRFS